MSPLRPKNDFNAEQVASREEHGHIRSLKFIKFWLVMASCGEFLKGLLLSQYGFVLSLENLVHVGWRSSIRLFEERASRLNAE